MTIRISSAIAKIVPQPVPTRPLNRITRLAQNSIVAGTAIGGTVGAILGFREGSKDRHGLAGAIFGMGIGFTCGMFWPVTLGGAAYWYLNKESKSITKTWSEDTEFFSTFGP